jgi:transcriptional regulator with XRE-family HTH domain
VDVKEIRIEKLRELLREHRNNKAALARTLHKAPAQVSQWFNGVRSITEESAREIEAAARRPRGWLDQLDDDGESPRSSMVLDEAIRSLGPEARREALDFIRYKLERARATFLAEKLGRYMAELDREDAKGEAGRPDDGKPAP